MIVILIFFSFFFTDSGRSARQRIAARGSHEAPPLPPHMILFIGYTGYTVSRYERREANPRSAGASRYSGVTWQRMTAPSTRTRVACCKAEEKTRSR